MPIKNWSTTPANNNATPPNGAPEGWNLSQINDWARQTMADVRAQWEQKEWFDFGHTPTFVSATSFTVSGDQTAIYHVNRRVRITDASTLYGKITASTFASPNTTVTVSLDSGSLSASISAVAVGSAVSGKALDVSGINGAAPADSPTFTGSVNIPGGAISPYSFKNKIMNGGFTVNQRAVTGTVTLSAGQYGHDRWKAGAGGCTYTYSTAGGVTTLTITAGTLQQVIEGINLMSGTHVLSWTGTAQGRIDGGSYGNTGITGTASAGTNQTIEFGTGTLSRVQYEPGSTITPFEARQYSIELNLCQRYAEFVSTQMVFSFFCDAAVRIFNVPIVFRVPKRATPTYSATFYYSNASGAGFGNVSATGATVFWSSGGVQGITQLQVDNLLFVAEL